MIPRGSLPIVLIKHIVSQGTSFEHDQMHSLNIDGLVGGLRDTDEREDGGMVG